MVSNASGILCIHHFPSPNVSLITGYRCVFDECLSSLLVILLLAEVVTGSFSITSCPEGGHVLYELGNPSS